jgi:hypothetical protein
MTVHKKEKLNTMNVEDYIREKLKNGMKSILKENQRLRQQNNMLKIIVERLTNEN